MEEKTIEQIEFENEALILATSGKKENPETETSLKNIACTKFDKARSRKTTETSLLTRKKGPWKIKWVELKSEITNWKGNTTSEFIIAFISLNLSVNDVISDSLVARSFLNGTYYIKGVLISESLSVLITNGY